jgi:hypothetical protein
MGYVVEELFAFVASDEDGDEGIVAVEMVGSDSMMSLVAADLMRIQEMVPFAEAIKQQTGHTVVLKHFTLLGEVSDEYLEQFAEPPGDSGDDQEHEGAGESAPDRRRGGNGSSPDDS